MQHDDRAQNRLLARLPTPLHEEVLDHAHCVSLQREQTIYEPGHIIKAAFFPVSALLSMSHSLSNSSTIEIHLVAAQGMLGATLLLGRTSAQLTTCVEQTGLAWKINAHTLKALARSHPPLQSLLLMHSQALLRELYQAIACNRHHSVEQQLSRWLLTYEEYTQHAQLEITHAQLARKLGVRREAISEAAFKLKRLGAIEYARGHITIVSRPVLLSTSCECYSIMQTLHAQKNKPLII